jgi:hypothetical protein
MTEIPDWFRLVPRGLEDMTGSEWYTGLTGIQVFDLVGPKSTRRGSPRDEDWHLMRGAITTNTCDAACFALLDFVRRLLAGKILIWYH